MSISFLIQDKIFEDDQVTLTDYLLENSIPYELASPYDFFHKKIKNPVFCRGSLEWIFQIQKINDSNYKTICNIENYDCKEYYNKYNKQSLLFNEIYEIANVCGFLRSWEGQPIFIRPSVGYKPKGFAGGVYKEQDRDYIKECFNNNDDVLIAPVKHIDYEYRFIVNNKNKYITGCQYKSFCYETKKLGFDASPKVPFEIQERFIDNVLSKLEWHPDPIYVIDIAESDAELYILEINALSTSGWYDCDYDKIVKEIIKYYVHRM